jgi:hypothetical protein
MLVGSTVVDLTVLPDARTGLLGIDAPAIASVFAHSGVSIAGTKTTAAVPVAAVTSGVVEAAPLPPAPVRPPSPLPTDDDDDDDEIWIYLGIGGAIFVTAVGVGYFCRCKLPTKPGDDARSRPTAVEMKRLAEPRGTAGRKRPQAVSNTRTRAAVVR